MSVQRPRFGVFLVFALHLAGCPQLDLASEAMNHHDKVTGEKSGRWTTFYTNGQKESEGEYVMGKKNGTWTYWSESGQVLRTEEFTHGELTAP